MFRHSTQFSSIVGWIPKPSQSIHKRYEIQVWKLKKMLMSSILWWMSSKISDLNCFAYFEAVTVELIVNSYGLTGKKHSKSTFNTCLGLTHDEKLICSTTSSTSSLLICFVQVKYAAFFPLSNSPCVLCIVTWNLAIKCYTIIQIMWSRSWFGVNQFASKLIKA